MKYGEPTKDDILKAINQPKPGKAAGPDKVQAEALEAHTETITKCSIPYSRFKNTWKEEPFKWKEGYLFKLSKKRDLSNCANYREVTLLSVPGNL
jgi:hypothetical protein